MGTRTPLFVKPPSFKWHLLLFCAVLAVPVYALLVYVIITPPSRGYSLAAEIGMWFTIACPFFLMALWAAKMARYISKRSGWNSVATAIGIMVLLIFAYAFELFIIANFAINWAMSSR